MFESISRGVLTCQDVRQINQSNRSDHSSKGTRGRIVSTNAVSTGGKKSMQTVLVKVGGSLLTLSDLPNRLRAMIDNITADRVILLAGGGRAADVVRNWDETHGLDSDAAHWLAIGSMGLTARLLTKLFPDAELVSDCASAHNSNEQARTVILDPRPVIEEASSEATKQLPTGWDCTSDATFQ